MKDLEIANLRLQQQQIVGSHFDKAQDLVQYMGALQAQDEAMFRWAVGLRLKKATVKNVETALDKGEILRTHVLRPTWHLVSAQDIYWILDLTAPALKRIMKGRHHNLELTPAVLTKSMKILEKALSTKDFVSRTELLTAFEKAKIATNENRFSHILFTAELEGMLVSGPTHNGKHTYALLEKRVKKKKLLNREEALAELAQRYFTSHGPATVQDFSWWSGLNLTDARKGLESIKKNLEEVKAEHHVYWMAPNVKSVKHDKNELILLPAYDEYLISYKDRSAVLDPKHQSHALSSNGIFYPVILVNGQAVGIWKRTFTKDKVKIETKYFGTASSAWKPKLKKAAEEYAAFVQKDLTIVGADL